MDYIESVRDKIVQTYKFLQDFVNYALYGDELGLAYAGIGTVNGRNLSATGLENVLFMGSKKQHGHKAKQGETWVNQKTGQEVKVKGRKPRKSKRMRRVHKNDYEEFSRVKEVLAQQERERQRAVEAADREREERTKYRPW